MQRKFYVRAFIIAAIFLIASTFYYLPFYVSKPGMAKELEPIIEVENGYEEEGSFMLTTVRMGRANIYSYLAAKFNKYHQIHPEEMIKSPDETDEEYNVRQLHLMTSSQTAAIEVSYQKAGKQIDYKYKGVYVLNVFDDMPAAGKLAVGDKIFEVDGREFESSDQFVDYVGGKKAGEEISLSFERDGKTKNVSLPIEPYKDNPEKVGVGIMLTEDKEVITDPEVTLDTEDIGGPSAGLMFSLEIYNQLTEDDLTNGYNIAGTGTIDPEGKVGRIGGIEQKVVAADKAGAEIFLAPFEGGAEESNYQAAVTTAKDIKTDMKIVPVNTFDEAVQYLERLEKK
ncbi:hypothetical protein CVD25_12730 [Bacillus canaveralius]|uniref:endopeptidase La n=1 Tax=Bacillus canaveralius TaxID=1403243 RepID=A0A2N5GNK8_9BACI|nr:SepM family pheromone-processing serine protease [Bacillus canaveralius]PLR84098.1 hypothetical protein CU635_07275 [Bacillus canaveralius]PLR96256.1 hypothetical protein CVD25_12730 [Bacillus canaveralius]